MNILLIIPDYSHTNIVLDVVSEVENLTKYHKTEIIRQNVTFNSLLELVSNNSYDIIHFAAHTNDNNDIILSNNDILTKEQLLSLIKRSKCKLVFFNVCIGAKLGVYISRNLNIYTIYTTTLLLDKNAWIVPLSFYSELYNLERKKVEINFSEIFNLVDDQSGLYNISEPVKYKFVSEQSKQETNLIDSIKHKVRLMDDATLIQELNKLISAIYELKNEMNLLKLRISNLEAYKPPLIGDKYIKVFIIILLLITFMMGYGLILLSGINIQIN